MKTAIFLGAGASKAEGIPVQNEIFKRYFQEISNNDNDEMNSALVKFFKQIFGIDVRDSGLYNNDFPTFEEIIGILDISEMRRETIRLSCLTEGSIYDNSLKPDFNKIVSDFMELKLIRLYLIILIAKVLHNKVYNPTGLHSQLINNLTAHNLIKDTIFITTNYDILIDSALVSAISEHNIDYGIDFFNYKNSNGWSKSEDLAVKLFKIHGSLHWLYCPTCNNLKITKKEGKHIHLVTDFSKVICSECGSIMYPIILPPTYFKDVTNVFLGSIWNKVENILRDIDHIIFCGYSFSDTDIHIKYLLKRVQISRSKRLSISVLNNYPGKTEKSLYEEEKRYKRFLGKDVNYTCASFRDLVNDPERYYNV